MEINFVVGKKLLLQLESYGLDVIIETHDS